MTRKWLLFGIVVVVGVGLDFWTKQWALGTLRLGETVYDWGGALKLTLSFNRGAAFGLNLGAASRLLFIVFSFVVLAWLLVVLHQTPSRAFARLLGISLVSAGAVGNLIDRIASSRGVTDFLGPYDLGFMLWPIFNVADCWVVVGIACLLLSMRHGSITEMPAQESSVHASATAGTVHVESVAPERESR